MATKESTLHLFEGSASHVNAEAASRATLMHQDVGFSVFDPPLPGLRRQYPHEAFASVPIAHGYSTSGNNLEHTLSSPFTPQPRGVPQWSAVPSLKTQDKSHHDMPVIENEAEFVPYGTVKSMEHKMNMILSEVTTLRSNMATPQLQTQSPADNTGPLDYETHKHRAAFWTENEWKEANRRAAGKTMQDQRKSDDGGYGFLRDGDGKIPSDVELEQMRRTARSVFNKYLQEDTAPESWNFGATSVQRRELRHEMESTHELFRLCDNGWKSEALAKKIYPQFKQTHGRRHDRLSNNAEELLQRPKWLKSTLKKKENANASEGLVDPDPPHSASRKRNRDDRTKTVVAEDAHLQKRRPALNIVNTM